MFLFGKIEESRSQSVKNWPFQPPFRAFWAPTPHEQSAQNIVLSIMFFFVFYLRLLLCAVVESLETILVTLQGAVESMMAGMNFSTLAADIAQLVFEKEYGCPLETAEYHKSVGGFQTGLVIKSYQEICDSSLIYI